MQPRSRNAVPETTQCRTLPRRLIVLHESSSGPQGPWRPAVLRRKQGISASERSGTTDLHAFGGTADRAHPRLKHLVALIGAVALLPLLSAVSLRAEPPKPAQSPAPPALSPADQTAVDRANKFVQRGNDFVKRDSLVRAKAEYQKALEIFPRHLDALYNLAVVCERLGKKDEALSHYQAYLKLAPREADVWTQVGVLRDEAGDRAGARQAYQQALEANPDFGRAHHNLGVLLEESGELDAAQRHFETFVQLEEKAGRQNGDAYYSLGTLHLARAQIRQAKMLLQKALDIDPSIAWYNNAMGDVYLAEKQPETALVYYRKALEKDPKYAPAYSGTGDACRQLDQRDQAAAAYRKALELRADYPVVHYKLGLLLEQSNPAEARKHFEKYLQSGKNLEFAKDVTAKLEKLKQPNPAP